jgi:hypothetical protein
MSGRERRQAARYVIGGMMLDLNGVLHETLDISPGAVAVVQEKGVDYSRLNVPASFICKSARALYEPLTSLQFITRRANIIVLGYSVSAANWEAILQAHDVRADMKQLEDVFG